MESEWVDTARPLQDFLDRVESYPGQPPSLYVDLEGQNLSRNGTISIVTILLEPEDRVYLIDVTTLGKAAFTTTSTKGQSLKDVLESEDFIKVFFDVRMDSDALYNLYGVELRGVEDLQLMEMAARDWSYKYRLKSLQECIRTAAGLGSADWRVWRRVKEGGKRLFAPDHGGSYNVFAKRPLKKALVRYCCQDVELMPRLRDRYKPNLCDGWWQKTIESSKDRVGEARMPENTQARDWFEVDWEYGERRVNPRTLGPDGWISWQPEGDQLLRELVPEASSRRAMPGREPKETTPTVPSVVSTVPVSTAKVDHRTYASAVRGDQQTYASAAKVIQETHASAALVNQQTSSGAPEVVTEDDGGEWTVVERRRTWGSRGKNAFW